MKNKKAFTLIEVLMVIVIVGILMGATMKFGGDRIGFLNNKNVKEQFISHYKSLFSSNMMTSYYLGDPYANMEINFYLGDTGLNYIYKGYNGVDFFSDIKNIDGGKYKIIDLSVDGKDEKSINLSFVPYVLGCEINGLREQNVNIDLIVNDSKKYCFQIGSDSCRISSLSCD